MTLTDNSKRIGRQPPYFSNLRRDNRDMFDYINTLDGGELWEKYVNYTIEFDQLHKEIQDMRKQLTYNRTGKLFVEYIGKHRYFIINLCRYFESSYSWKVFQKLKWTIEKYKEYLSVGTNIKEYIDENNIVCHSRVNICSNT